MTDAELSAAIEAMPYGKEKRRLLRIAMRRGATRFKGTVLEDLAAVVRDALDLDLDDDLACEDLLARSARVEEELRKIVEGGRGEQQKGQS